MFLPYLKNWEKSVLERSDGNFTVAERNKMMLSDETRKGLEFTGRYMCYMYKIIITIIPLVWFILLSVYSPLFYWLGKVPLFFARSKLISKWAYFPRSPWKVLWNATTKRESTREPKHTRVSQEHTGSQSDKWNMHGYCQRKLQGQEKEFLHDTRRTGERKSTTQEEKKIQEWKGLYFIHWDIILIYHNCYHH